MKSIVIEVGANRGTDTRRLLQEYSCQVVSFEPVPELYYKLSEDFKDKKNLTLHRDAIGECNEIRSFHITRTDPKIAARYGASSLFRFDKDLHTKWSRPDFYTQETITVNMISLDYYINTNLIDEVLYLHCDAQGNDINVLRGLKENYMKVKKGIVEATNKIPLYADSDNTVENVCDWLRDHGFNIDSVTPNDKLDAEANIRFSR